MKKRIIRYLKHILLTVLALLFIGITILIYLNGSLEYGQDPISYDLNQEGPHVFYTNDSIINVNYIKGSKQEGFYVNTEHYPTTEKTMLNCFFPLDNTTFEFELKSDFEIPKSVYNDGNKILAISDIESGYKTFRDFLIQNKVIDANLNWTFGKGHLVLVGDFVDRGNSTTQVLWFIYKLDHEAKKHGGNVHFIIGNHELYNMQGQYKSAEQKYYAVASILGKQQYDLYSKSSVLGRWLSSKNTIERINGTLFAHGGIHPELAAANITLNDINQINRDNYYKTYFPKPEKTIAQLVTSHKKGICWYRGYFKDDLSPSDMEKGLKKFGAKNIVVGHTIQSKIKKLYDGRLYAIDVKHPKDYIKNWPNKKSEGLLIEEGKYYRVLHNGDKKAL